MSKLVTILLIIWLFLYLPLTVLADTPVCEGVGITYSPNAFYPNPTDITLNFKISNKTTAENIAKRGNVRLHFISAFSGGLGDINTKSVPVTITDTGGSFSINVLDIDSSGPFSSREKLTESGQHEAVLDWQGPSSNNPIQQLSGNVFNELCKGIKYYVGASYACVIDPALPDLLPKAQPFNLAFSGKPSSEYQLFVKPGGFSPGALTAPKYFVTKTRTNVDGQGVFNNFGLTNVNDGDSVNISIAATDAFKSDLTNVNSLNPLVGPDIDSSNVCTITKKVALNAPIPKTPSSVPLPGPGAGVISSGTYTATSGAKICQPGDKNCTTAGGQELKGCTDDKENPGIATAIGCVHTNPAALVKDLLTFVVAAAGGLAFLMMVLGAFQLLTSQGNPDALNAGRDRLTNAIIGLLFIIFAVLLLQIVGVDILRLPGFGK